MPSTAKSGPWRKVSKNLGLPIAIFILDVYIIMEVVGLYLVLPNLHVLTHFLFCLSLKVIDKKQNDNVVFNIL